MVFLTLNRSVLHIGYVGNAVRRGVSSDADRHVA
jgi:hypothetical protein